MKKIIKRVYSKITRTFELNKIAIKLSSTKSISKKEAKFELKNAKKMGFNVNEYFEKGLYELDLSDKEEFLKYKKLKQERSKISSDFYTDIAIMRSGLSKAKIKTDMNLARIMGISNLKYVQKCVWSLNEAERKKLSKFLIKDKERIAKNKKKYVSTVMEKTGWTKGKTELEILKSSAICGASYEDYCSFRLYEIPLKKHSEYITLDMFDKMRLKYNEHFTAKEFFDDKAKFNETFSDLINRSWFVNKNLSYEEFEKNISSLKDILVKPLSSTKGMGIKKYKCGKSKKARKELYEELINLPESIIEEYIVQHKDVMKFCPTSVNTVRITTIYHNNKCKFLYAVFRMGQGDVVDNFHAGGIAATIDVKTGIVVSNASDLNGNVFSKNPYSKLKIKGFKIPHWDKIISTCKKASNRVDGVSLIGWDFAITENGVELIEGNPGVSYVLAQIPNIEDRIGLSPVMVKPYLEEKYYLQKIK